MSFLFLRLLDCLHYTCIQYRDKITHVFSNFTHSYAEINSLHRHQLKWVSSDCLITYLRFPHIFAQIYTYFINLWICIVHFLKRKQTLNINIEYFTFKYYWNIDLLVWKRLDSIIKISLHFVLPYNIQTRKQVYKIFKQQSFF